MKFWPPEKHHLRASTGATENCHRSFILVHSQWPMDTAKLNAYSAYDAHYWCHALIALDWYRYAQHDPLISPTVDPQSQPFLIYNRAWSGSREYRLKFVELLVDAGLVHSCKTTFSPNDGALHYTKHLFRNRQFKVTHRLEDYFEPNTASSQNSADYHIQDYLSCNLEVVLETVFDETYNHLTEKSLRPIALGKPFMIASTPGSLDYLKRYGFQTFSPLINEHYDKESDSLQRLQCIVQELQRIALLPRQQQQDMFEACQRIADHNRKRFFSRDFYNQIIEEYCTNMERAVALARHTKI